MRFLIMRFYCQKDSSYMTQIYERSKTQKKAARVLRAAYSSPHTAHYRLRHINLLVALYNALLNTFFSQLLVSKPHTKSSSALDYMTDIVQRLT